MSLNEYFEIKKWNIVEEFADDNDENGERNSDTEKREKRWRWFSVRGRRSGKSFQTGIIAAQAVSSVCKALTEDGLGGISLHTVHGTIHSVPKGDRPLVYEVTEPSSPATRPFISRQVTVRQSSGTQDDSDGTGSQSSISSGSSGSSSKDPVFTEEDIAEPLSEVVYTATVTFRQKMALPAKSDIPEIFPSELKIIIRGHLESGKGIPVTDKIMAKIEVPMNSFNSGRPPSQRRTLTLYRPVKTPGHSGSFHFFASTNLATGPVSFFLHTNAADLEVSTDSNSSSWWILEGIKGDASRRFLRVWSPRGIHVATAVLEEDRKRLSRL